MLPSWVDDPSDSPKSINARVESVAEKPIFRDAFEDRRCLVLADGFYEWKGQRGSRRLWEHREEPNGNVRETVTIITTDANDVVADIHDRMPVMLEQGEEEQWLTATDEDVLQGMLDPYPVDQLRGYPVSKKVNNPANDSPDIIEEIDIGEQVGFDEFAS